MRIEQTELPAFLRAHEQRLTQLDAAFRDREQVLRGHPTADERQALKFERDRILAEREDERSTLREARAALQGAARTAI